jgi:hypothetical protein
VGALVNEEVGKYINAHCASCFQKVGTFRIAAGQKQGGNVASYFCTPDGSVLHILAGPVDANTMLREARWVIETYKLAELETRTGRAQLQALFRKAHAERLRHEHRHHTSALPTSSANPSAGDLAALLGQLEARRLNRQGQVHLLLASAPLVRIDRIYALVFEKILNERISTNPVASD